MVRLLVSQTDRQAYRTIEDALKVPVPAGERHILIAPGQYRTDELRIWGVVTLTAVGGPGSAVIDGAGEYSLQVEGRVTLQGLVLRNWHSEGSALRTVGGTAVAQDCEFVARSAKAVAAWRGAELFLHNCTVKDGPIVYSDSAGVVENTQVTGSGVAGIALRDGSRVSVRNSRVQGAGESGIWVTSGANPLIEQCQVEDAKHAGILIQSHSTAAVRGGTIRRTDKCGLVVRDTAQATVDGLHIAETELDGIWCTTSAILTATAVTVRNAKRMGFMANDGAKARLNGCDIERAAEYGVCVNESTEVVLMGGTVTECEFGIGVSSGGSLVAEGVTVSASRTAGVSADPDAEVVLRSCTVSGTDGPGLLTAKGAKLSAENVVSQSNKAPDRIGVEVPGAAEPVPAAAADGPRQPVETATPSDASADSVDGLLAELTAMVGLAEVKEEIGKLVKFLQIAEQRRRAGLPEGPVIGRHLVFSGSPGTGKTTVARLYGRLLAALGAVSGGHFTEVSRGDLVGKALGETTAKTTEVFNRARGGVLFVDEAYTLSRRFGSGADFGQEAIDTLVKLMEDHRDEVIVVFAGYSAEMREFLTANPGLRSRISRTIEFEDYSADELLSIVDHIAEQYGFRLAEETRSALLGHFQHTRRTETFGNGREARRVFEAALGQQALRLADLPDAPSAGDLVLLLPEDLDGVVDRGLGARFDDARDPAQLRSILDQLAAMVGLDEIKAQIRDLLDLIVAARRRRQAGLPADPSAGHLIFSGPPGTGKTTVARLYASLLAALGVLARGQVVEVSRADLIAGYVGQTALKTTEAFERARGGVLFVDEAYSLTVGRGTGHDFGQEAIDTLVKLMEDHRDEVVVIAAGYTDEMNRFLATNPGLASRFSRTIEFPRYDREELLTILVRQAEQSGFEVPGDTLDAFRAHLADHTDRFAQGNAREVRKLFESVQTAHARRIAQLERAGTQATVEQLRRLIPQDCA